MSTVEGAIEAFNKLIHQDEVPAILGVWTSHVAKSVFPIAQENRIVAFSPVVVAAGLTEIGEFHLPSKSFYRYTDPWWGSRVTLEKLGYQRVATIGDTIDFASRNSTEVYRETLADNGVEVLTTETFATGDNDFSSQLTRIKALNPDAIFVSAQQIEVIKILTQGRELGIPVDVPFISLVSCP